MNQERLIRVPNGWAILPVTIAIFALAVWLFVLFGFSTGDAHRTEGLPPSAGCWIEKSHRVHHIESHRVFSWE